METVAIVSGGMDSVTLAYWLRQQGANLYIVSFNYGQRHVKELEYAKLCAVRLGTHHTVIDLYNLGGLLGGSALTDDIPVPEGHYADDNMRVTVVPNRNAIMLSIAYGIAIAQNAESVAIGVHAGDHPIYPDCRPEFIRSFDQMERIAVEGYGHPELFLYAPFVNLTKKDIVEIGIEIGVPYQDTWSCYKGNNLHCGVCGTCVERKEAFRLAGIEDPTYYAT